MPTKPMRPCRAPNCRRITSSKYCDDHANLDQMRYKQYDRITRDKETDAFYKSKAWRLVREMALNRDLGLCQECLKHKDIVMAALVDHIVPIKINWKLRLEITNLQSLCTSCHRIKTENDKKKYKLR